MSVTLPSTRNAISMGVPKIIYCNNKVSLDVNKNTIVAVQQVILTPYESNDLLARTTELERVA